MDVKVRYRKRRRRAGMRKLSMVAAAAVSLGIGVLFFLWLPLFRLHTIAIIGSADEKTVNQSLHQYLDDQYRWYWPSSNLFLIDTGALEEYLRTQTVGLAVIQKDYPTTIRVVFLKETPKFLWCTDASLPESRCYYIDDTGVVVNEAPQFSENPLPLIIVSATTSTPLGTRLIRVALWEGMQTIEHFLNVKNLTLRTIEIKNAVATLRTSEGWDILIGTDVVPSRAVDDLQLLLDQKIREKRNRLEYIDLRFPNKAFYKLR